MIRAGRVKYLFILCWGLYWIPMGFAQDDIIVIQSPPFGVHKRSLVLFPHDKHNEAAEIESCNECHHAFENGELLADESSEDQRCSDCHDIASVNEQPGLRKAFHSNCMGCHSKKNTGPVMCGQCHIRAIRREVSK